MSLDSDILRIEEELDNFDDETGLPTRTALYRNLAALRLLNWIGSEDGGIGTLVEHNVSYLPDTVHTLAPPNGARYAELYFEASDYDDPRRVARLTLGTDAPTSGTGAAQHGRVVRNEDIFKYSKIEEIRRIKIIKFPSITNLRLEVNYYA